MKLRDPAMITRLEAWKAEQEEKLARRALTFRSRRTGAAQRPALVLRPEERLDAPPEVTNLFAAE
ncbi:MAG: hypothetical protein ACU0CI_03355 [Shimia sp.]